MLFFQRETKESLLGLEVADLQQAIDLLRYAFAPKRQGVFSFAGDARDDDALCASGGNRSGKPKRKPLPDHLPRESVEHLPTDCSCPDCGGALKKLGEDVAEVLEYVPANFRVIRHIRPRFACVLPVTESSRPTHQADPSPEAWLAPV